MLIAIGCRKSSAPCPRQAFHGLAQESNASGLPDISREQLWCKEEHTFGIQRKKLILPLGLIERLHHVHDNDAGVPRARNLMIELDHHTRLFAVNDGLLRESSCASVPGPGDPFRWLSFTHRLATFTHFSDGETKYIRNRPVPRPSAPSILAKCRNLAPVPQQVRATGIVLDALDGLFKLPSAAVGRENLGVEKVKHAALSFHRHQSIIIFWCGGFRNRVESYSKRCAD